MNTNLKVFYNGESHEVKLTNTGLFSVQLDDDNIERTSYAELNQYVEGREARRVKKAATPSQSLDVTAVLETEWNNKKFAVHNFEVTGMSIDGHRAKTKGLPKDVKVAGYTTVYRRFTLAEQEQAAELWSVLVKARETYRKFLQERQLGNLKEIARQVDAGSFSK